MTAPAIPPVVPAYVSQHTALAVLGVSSRRFRELVRRHGIRHVRDGKLVIVALDDWRSAMARLATVDAPEADSADAPASVDDMLASLGRRRAS